VTKSDFIRRRCEPLFQMVEKFVHPEEKENVRAKVELWILRLIADVEHLAAIDLSDVDTGKYGETPLD